MECNGTEGQSYMVLCIGVATAYLRGKADDLCCLRRTSPNERSHEAGRLSRESWPMSRQKKTDQSCLPSYRRFNDKAGFSLGEEIVDMIFEEHRLQLSASEL